jgi:hypothetical protein
VTAAAKRNPKDFLDADLTGSYVLTTNSFGAFKAGGFAKYETDQSFDNKQLVYGVRGTYLKLGVFTQFHDWVTVHASGGQVDPKGDEDRHTALGTSDLPKYYRNDVECFYHVDVRWKISSELQVKSVELGYLYFLESSAPAQVAAAGLDRHHLATARVKDGTGGFGDDKGAAHSGTPFVSGACVTTRCDAPVCGGHNFPARRNSLSSETLP